MFSFNLTPLSDELVNNKSSDSPHLASSVSNETNETIQGRGMLGMFPASLSSELLSIDDLPNSQMSTSSGAPVQGPLEMLGETLGRFFSRKTGKSKEVMKKEINVNSIDIKTIIKEIRKTGAITNMAAKKIIMEKKINDNKDLFEEKSIPSNESNNLFDGKETFLTKTAKKIAESEPIYFRNSMETKGAAPSNVNVVEWSNMSKRWLRRGSISCEEFSLEEGTTNSLNTELELLEKELALDPIEEKRASIQDKNELQEWLSEEKDNESDTDSKENVESETVSQGEKRTCIFDELEKNLEKTFLPKKSSRCFLLTLDNPDDVEQFESKSSSVLVTIQDDAEQGEEKSKIVTAFPIPEII